ncbi:MAG: hypothetical protein DWP94_13530 [Flavobacterium sp.]|nr:MAG: hypothetical protein DWP94_13530 [Flavobacterium sp.]
MRIQVIDIAKFFGLIILISFSYACSNDLEEQEVNTDSDGESPVYTNPEDLLNVTERGYLHDLLTVDAAMPEYWHTFDAFRNYPIYIRTADNRGILINPPESELVNSREIPYSFEEFEPLKLYRNDSLHQFASDILDHLQFYATDIYNGNRIYLHDQKDPPSANSWYLTYKNRNGYFHVALFFHELFHSWVNQESIYPLFDNGESVYDIGRFPLNEDTLPLLVLLFDVMKDAYHVEPEKQLDYLKYYVSIMNTLNEIDPTPDNLIRHQAFYVEKREGTPRYIEVFSTLHTLNNNTIEDPTHGYADYVETLTNWIEVRNVYGHRMYYHTGAGVIFLLKELGYENIEDQFFIPTETPFDVAFDFVAMSQSELENKLNEVKTLYGWNDYVNRANYLLNL